MHPTPALLLDHAPLPSTQRGSVLLLSLVFIIILTALSFSGINLAMVEEKITVNARDANLAFEAAESALNDGELTLQRLTLRPNPGCGTPPCALNTLNTLSNGRFDNLANNWWIANGFTLTNPLTGVAQQPAYVVEELAFIRDSLKQGTGYESGVYFYRLSAAGIGSSARSQAVVQSTYSRRY